MNTVILALFFSLLIHQELNIAYRIKKLLSIKPTKNIKILDCFPCFTFWLACIISLITSEYIFINLATTFVIATIIDKWN